MIMQCKCYKVYEGYVEFSSTQLQKRRERRKTSFPKESVENVDM